MENENKSNNIEITYDEIQQEDLEIIANSKISFKDFENSTFLVTGATGLIGSMMVKALLCINRVHKLNINIIAMVRDYDKAYSVFGKLLERSELRILVHDITTKLENIDENVDYIIHTASVTNSKMMIEKPVETINISVLGTNNILELAKNKKCKGIVYLSSMEAYGIINDNENAITEDRIGYLDLSSVRSCYPESKRLCECLCVSYAEEYGVNVRIARLAQTFGAGILPTENRVFAQFARSAINKTDIILHTEGKSEGNYCYIRDAIIALIILLIKGKNGEIYNISNEGNHSSIIDMAQLVAKKITGNKIKVVFDIPDDNQYGYAPPVRMKLSSDKLRRIGWVPEVNLEESYKRMIKSMMLNT